jgi:hypothetical protein
MGRARVAGPERSLPRSTFATRIARGAGVRVRTAASTSVPGDNTMADDRRQDSADRKAHGAHGKGFSDEQRVDEQATDTGDDAQLRRAGGGGDQAPNPDKFRENASGRAGGAGWGSEQVGGSVVDRRPPDGGSGSGRGNA